jgi:penicillin-insensitive murein endopeptidase
MRRHAWAVACWVSLLLAACSGSPASRLSGSALSGKASAQDHQLTARAGKVSAGATSRPASGVEAHAADSDRAEPAAPDAGDPAEQVRRVLALPGSVSTSLGGPAGGRIRGAVALPDSGPGYKHNPRRPYEARFGTVETVQSIMRAAAVVERELAGSTLVVNDLGLIEGGPIVQHGSHQAGRDVDVLFYLLDARSGEPVPSVGAPLDPKGIGWDFKDLATPADDHKVKLDLPRTWRFFQALLEVAPEHVQRVYLVEHLRTLLLAEAERSRAPVELRERFADLSCQPSTPHDDHAHIRFFCTPEDMAEGCLDSAPVYPWRAGALRALGLEPVLAPGRTAEERAARRVRTTSAAKAKQSAGPMHAKVKRFLAERAHWLRPPRTGRLYCR